MDKALCGAAIRSHPMSPITIRPVQWADLPRLSEMITALAAHHGDEAQVNIDALQRDIFSASPWIRVSVAVCTDQVVGYAALCPLIKLQYCKRGIDLHHIYVDKAHRNEGVGQLLIADAIARAQGLGASYLMVGTTPTNKAAQMAYKACGFKMTAHNPNRFIMQFDERTA